MSDPGLRPRVILTGAAGFIGSHLRRQLSPAYRVLSVDISPLPSPLAEDEVYAACDLGDPEAIRRLAHEHSVFFSQAAGLIHLAAYYDFTNRPDARYARLLAGLPVLLEAFARGPQGAPFIFASSMAALAPTQPGQPLDPTSPKFAPWEYPKFKVACEAILDAVDIPQPLVQLVTAGVYSDWAELVPLFHLIEAVSRSAPERVFYPADPDRGLTYVHIDDLTDAYVRALKVFTRRWGHYRLLIGERQATTYRQIRNAALRGAGGSKSVPPIWRLPRPVVWLGAATLGAMARVKKRRRFIQPWMIRFAGEHFEFNLSQTEEVLGWKPAHYLGAELAGLIERARNHPDEWRTRNHARPW